MRSKIFINGEWVDGKNYEPVIDKYTGKPFGEIAVASLEDVDAAIRGVKIGAEKSKLLPFERSTILNNAAKIVMSRRDKFVEIMVKEGGFTKAECENEVKRAEQILLLCAEEAKRISGEIVPMAATPGLQDRMGFTIRLPRGVVCAITPFNAPLSTVAHKLGPALAAGNSVILKPAGYTPLTSVLLCQALLDAGLPPQLISLVNGAGSKIGSALLNDPRINFYTFTGSTAIGLEIQKAARFRGTSLELGSIATTILCADADIEAALPKLVNACFRKAGQICTSTQRLLVDKRIAHDVAEQLVCETRKLKIGDPSDMATNIGPMISLKEAERAESWVAEAASQGAKVLVGGSCHDSVMEPTILSNVNFQMRVVSEEVFAPIVSVIEFDSFEDAIEKANSSSYGLSAGIFTSNIHTAMRAARALHFGGVHINETSSSRVDVMPFGGVKDSGYGHEGPYYAIREMTEERLVTISY